jgi:hypothetical protein
LRRAWYENPWVMVGAGYVFPPLGLFLMWRYGPWPVQTKVLVTAIGLTLMVLSSYITSTYVMPRFF